MSKSYLKKIQVLLVPIFILFMINNSMGQNNDKTKTTLVSYILELESTYNIKFSFTDNDLADIQFTRPNTNNLLEAINYIKRTTQLNIKKISERYYGIINSKTVDICGNVLDNYENNTIPGATVQVLGTSFAMVTNAKGNFSFIDVPREAVLQINFLGFKPRFIKVQDLLNKAPCTNINLAPSYQELDEVIVYKFLTDGITKMSDASIEINTEKFGILPGQIEPDVLQTIQALPGIRSVDETVSDINVRGGTNDQNLILWDEIKMYQSGHFFGLISAFNPYLTENVTVIKNGTSAVYGDGVSSVLDMRTKNNIENSFFGGAGFNLISGDAFGQVSLTNKLAIQFSGRRSYTDYLDTPTYNTFSEKAFQDSEVESDRAFYFYDFTGKVLYDINNDQRLRLSFINLSNNLNYLELNDQGEPSDQSNLNQGNISFGGTLESEWTDRFSSKLNFYYTRYKLDVLSISSDNRQFLNQNNRVLEKSAKLITNYKIEDQINILGGYQITETGIENITDINEPNFVRRSKGVVVTQSLFTEINYASTNERMNATLGGRLNYVVNKDSFEKFIFEPRINFNYEFLTNVKAELLGEFKSQSTNQIIDLEQNFLGVENRRWVLANETTLPITTSKQGSFGINYDKNSFYLGIEGFYKEVNGVNVRTQGFQNENQFSNELGNYVVKGLEFLINKKNNKYSTWLSYTYNINEYNFDEITPSNFPNNLDIRHSINLAATYSIHKLKAGIGLNYRSGRPYTQPTNQNAVDDTVFPNRINYKTVNSSRLPEYIRADISANYEFELSARVKASLGASILNVTNRTNILNTYYRLSSDNSIEEVKRESLGTTPNVSFRVWF